VVRKELAGLPADAPARAAPDEGIYTPEWTDRTYAECLRRAEGLLFEGGRVVVDAAFGEEHRRRDFLGAAARLSLPALFLLCRTSPEVARNRIGSRRGDASDADVSVYERAAGRWQALGPLTRPAVREVSTDGPPGEALARSIDLLREARLMD
jgi:hypothetical protein